MAWLYARPLGASTQTTWRLETYYYDLADIADDIPLYTQQHQETLVLRYPYATLDFYAFLKDIAHNALAFAKKNGSLHE